MGVWWVLGIGFYNPPTKPALCLMGNIMRRTNCRNRQYILQLYIVTNVRAV